jgi:tRNA G18 (ribose-2'-O)-methylase SpoU
MRRGVDSLNVAAAAAVAFWELTRAEGASDDTSGV